MTWFRYVLVFVFVCSNLLAVGGENETAEEQSATASALPPAFFINENLFVVAPGTSTNLPGVRILTFLGGSVDNQAVLPIMRGLLRERGRFELVDTGTESITLMILACFLITNTRGGLAPDILSLVNELYQSSPELVARLSDDGLGTLMDWEIDRANHFIDNMREQNMTHVVSDIRRLREMNTQIRGLRDRARVQMQVAGGGAGAGASARTANASTNANTAAAAANLGGSPHVPGLGRTSE